MRTLVVSLAMLVAAGGAGSANAAFVDFAASTLNGNAVTETDLGPGALAIDPHFANAAPIEVAIVLEDADAGAVAWNALVDNLTGEVWSSFAIELFGAPDLLIGSVAANAGAVETIAATPISAIVFFDPAEAAGIDLGAPFGAGTDWVVTGATGPGFRLRFTPVPVPEPASLVLLGLGIAAIATARR
jgi:hypothetical protein